MPELTVVDGKSALLHVVIDRGKWDIWRNRKIALAREGDHPKYDYGHLLDTRTGLMCCLGFAGLKCGISEDWLANTSMPSDEPHDFWLTSLLEEDEDDAYNGDPRRKVDSPLANELSAENDSDDPREAEIQRLGLLGGIEFEFVGEYLDEKQTVSEVGNA
jgi:hypothetical protein